MTLRFRVVSPEAMAVVGERLADLLRPGDLVVLDGPLGAGKTTLVRALGRALGVRGEVTSPTFVIARRHAPGPAGIPLLHIDAYRASAAELWDQELDLQAAECVTVVEWGVGKVEGWTDSMLLVGIAPIGDRVREVAIEAIGARWREVPLEGLVPS